MQQYLRETSSTFPIYAHVTPSFREKETEARDIKDLPQVTTHSPGGQRTEQDTAQDSDLRNSAQHSGYTAPLDLRVGLWRHVIQAKRKVELEPPLSKDIC